MTRYGYTEDYEYNATHKRIYFTIWSGPFMSTWEADGYATPGAKQVTLNTYAQTNKVVVKLPDGVTFPRTDKNYEAIDAAINAALNEWEQKRGSIQILPDSRSTAEMRAADEVLVTWKVTEETTYQATVSRATFEQMNADGDLTELVALEGEEVATVLSGGVTERVITETEGAPTSDGSEWEAGQ